MLVPSESQFSHLENGENVFIQACLGLMEAASCGALGAVSSSPCCYDTTPAKSNLREKGFILAHSERLQSIMSAAVTVVGS